ncbi:sigma-70 family RNA polymerase sigma factor (plasmid) [Skermanella mucosa]|uniref:RNA polymerase sigma factor n=1 Tax=Skermanella mucosa TaxID=1789672 RepID=UPI00192A91B7|nr:sigma-70 family RNA polymerase sigma factor [Skermanella mucosa]UEM25183.1 sigma-70 family RNA polymerase sigma factor [Skermanella mucosa]
MPDDDRDHLAVLMRAAQAGNAAAYARLLREVAPIVRRTVGSRWGTGPDAEDIVQDVLLSVHAVRHAYDPGRPFLPWLLAIVRNRVADAARRHARRAVSEVAIEAPPEAFSPEHFAGDAAGTDREGITSDRLRIAIADLPRRQRIAVELLKVDEMSLKEAAAATGMSVAALKVAMHRAIRSLRAALGRGA